MIDIFDVLMIALIIEAIVNSLKPIWTGGEGMSVSEYVSMAIGVLIAVTCKIDIVGYVVELTTPFPGWMQYVFYALTGIAIGRGTNFLYDLWQKMMEWKTDGVLPGLLAPVQEATVDVEIANWNTKQLADFCELNGVPAGWCVDKEDYIEAITNALANGRNEPPEEGGAE